MAFDRKKYMQEYIRDPKNRAAQKASCAKYRAKKASTPEGLKDWRDKKRAYNATPQGKRNNRNRVLRFHYGITLEEYEQMFSAQKGVCAICGDRGRADRASPLDVDHDHDTGKIRGLLCFMCNNAIGLLREKPEFLKSAIAYLRKHAKRR